MSEARQYQRQISRILAKWAARQEIEKQARWPAGAPGSKGGQFAPAKSGGYSSYANKPWPGEEGSGAAKFSSYGSLFGGQSKFPGGQSPSWAGQQEAGYDKPAAPPPGAKPHPHVNDKGQPVTINYPSKASDRASWTDPARTATFTPGSATPDTLHGVPMKPWTNAPRSEHEWANVPGQDSRIDDNEPFTPTEGKSIGAGVIVREPDGRIWLTTPTNSFGGYRNTFPKGTVEHGLSMQASAIKEAYEETGLQIRITGILGDYERTTSKARFYIAERVGGTPSAMGWESQAIRLATEQDAAKLLNMGVDKGILSDLNMEGFFDDAKGRIRKAAWQKQERWPKGSPLGGQWKTMDANGLTVPPTVAGGLGGTNPQYQKKMNAAYSAAQAGQKTAVLDLAIATEKKVKEFEAAGTKNGHSKNTAMVSQYLTELASNLFAMPKVQALAEKIMGWLKLSAWSFLKPKDEGSNPGAYYADEKGETWLVKGNLAASTTGGKVSDERAHNEVLASKLMLAAGAGAPEMKIIDLEGKHGAAKSGPGSLGVASKIVAVKKFDLSNPAHLAAAQADFAVHAWLGNWDVLGASLDNTMIGADGKAVCIDPGGAILFRAQGEKKGAGQFDASAADFETMRKSNHYQQSVYGSMTKSQLAESAAKLAGMTDDTIRALVKSYAGGDEASQKALADTLIARRDAILAKAGVTKSDTLANKPGAPAAAIEKPAATPPSVTQATAPTKPVAGLEKPTFDDTYGKGGYYDKLAAAMLAAHAAGDMAALKATTKNKKGDTVFATLSNGKLTKNASILKPFYDALEADLAAAKGQAAQALAGGSATITGTDGKAWVSDDKGVLQPVAGQGGAAPASPAAPAAASKSGVVDDEKLQGILTEVAGDNAKLSAIKPDSETGKLFAAAKAGDTLGVVTAEGQGPYFAQFQQKLIQAMSVSANSPAPAAAPPTAAPAAPAPAKLFKLNSAQATAVVNAFKEKYAGQYVDAVKGEGVFIRNLATSDPDKLVNFIASSAQMRDLQMMYAKNAGADEATLAIIANAKLPDHHEKAMLTEDEFDQLFLKHGPKGALKNNAYSDLLYHATGGNIGIVQSMNFDDTGLVYPAQQAVVQAMAAKAGLLATDQAASPAAVAPATAAPAAPAPAAPVTAAPRAASKPVVQTPQPAPQPAPKVPAAAAPNFDALKMTTTTNAAVFNSKLAAIKAAFEAGDENAILGMKFGINTTSKKAAKIANDALAALGSVHQVQAGQDANSHPALTGGTAQAPAAASKPAADPFAVKPTDLSDTSWVKVSANEKIVEVKEQFGVKSAIIEVAPKGYDPSAFGAPPDFFTNGTQGETGKWKSSKKEVNEANNAAVQEIFDTAIKNGTPEKLKAMKFPLVVNGSVKMVGIEDHKATEVKEYFNATLAELQAQLQPTYKTQTSGSMVGSYNQAANAIAASFKKKSYPEFATHTARAADYLILSKDASASVPVPMAGQFKEMKKKDANFKEFAKASEAGYKTLSAAEQSAANAYTGNAYKAWNYALRKGQYEDLAPGGKAMVKAFAKAATEIPEGTILWRGIDVGLDTYKSVVGGLLQDGSFNSASYGAKPAFQHEPTFLRIHIPKGVKAMDATLFSKFDDGEREIIIQNNVRYMVLKAEHHKNWVDSDGYSHGPKNIIDMIALPHDV